MLAACTLNCNIGIAISTSGGDTTLKGAVVTGNQVSTNVGGNFTIASLQDSNTYKDSSQQAGGSVMVGISSTGPVSGTLNLGQTKINSNFTSVGEQSAIRAGDGGFAVNVQGKTDLVGGQITSTQAAVDAGKNTYSSAGGTTTTDLQNTAAYSAQSTSISLGAGSMPGKSASAGMSGVGFGSDKASANSTTTAGISGVAGNTAVRTGDAPTGLTAIFNKDQVKQEVAAQVAITSEFGKQASKAVGDYAATQLKKAQDDKDQAGIAAWNEGGASRVALHALVGGLTGGAAGAVGAGTASAAAPSIDELQGKLQDGLKSAGLGESAAKVIASLASGATAAGIGAAASGGSTAGAATAFNADMNNRQLHALEKNLLKTKAAEFAEKLKKDGYTSMTEDRALAILTEQVENRIDETQAKRLDTATMDDALKAQAQKYLNQIGSATGTYDDGRGNQIKYFTNTTASDQRRIEDYKNPSINAEPNVPAADYVTVQGGGLGVSGATSVNLHNGEVFVGGSKSYITPGVGGSITFGRMLDAPPLDASRGDAASNMLGGASAQSAVCAGGLCLGINQSIAKPNERPTAVEFGVGTPGVSAGVGVSIPVPGTKK